MKRLLFLETLRLLMMRRRDAASFGFNLPVFSFAVWPLALSVLVLPSLAVNTKLIISSVSPVC